MSDKINKKLVDQAALGELSKLLKTVSNPTIYSSNTGFSDFELKTILTRSDLSVNNKILVVVNGSDNSNGIVLFSGYLTLGNTPVIRGINLGSIKITELGYRYDSSEKLSILISVKNEEEVQPVLTSLFVEVFYGKTDENGNKNRCSEINSTVLVDTDTIASIEDSESELKFSAIIVDKDGNELRIDQDSDEKYIDSIETAKLSEISDKLSKNIEISLNGDVTGNGEIDWTSSDDKFQLNINTELSESLELPLATSEKIGGIKIAVTDLGKNNHPVQLDEEGNAYVTFDSDIHRYKSMPEDAEIGDIVLYIGNSTSQFINGYFYKRAYTGFIFPLGNHFLPVTSAWLIRQNPTTDYTFVAQKISEYDETSHELKPGDLNIELNVDTLVKDPEAEDPETADLLVDEEKTTFTITNGLYFSDVLTYKKIKEFGIELDPNYITYSEEHRYLYPLSIKIAYNTNTPSWVQKNVQPILNVASALVYKGVTTWEELEAKTATAEPGDFYTISDKHNQEYFFKNLETVSTWEDQWEYMGEIVNVTIGPQLTVNNPAGSYENGDVIPANTSLVDVIRRMLSTVKKSSIKQNPTILITVSGGKAFGSYEYGTSITATFTCSILNLLQYTSYTSESSTTTIERQSGEWSLSNISVPTLTNHQLNATKSVVATATYNESTTLPDNRKPHNSDLSVGDLYGSKSLTSASKTYTPKYGLFYGLFDSKLDVVESTNFRVTFGNAPKSLLTSTPSLTIDINKKCFAVAVPSNYTLKKAIDNTHLSNDITNDFEGPTEVDIKNASGSNYDKKYNLYIYESDNVLDGNVSLTFN